MPGRNANSGSYRHGFNGMVKDDELKGSGNSYDFGARIYDPRLGRWLAVDPLMAKYTGQTPYNYALNSPLNFVDQDGKEPARNQAGTIQQAIEQWRERGLTTMEEIKNFMDHKGTDAMAIRYVYTEDKGWIDMMHYFGTQVYGKTAMDLLEPASGNALICALFFSETAENSYFSYEDKPSNKFGSEKKHTITVSKPNVNVPGDRIEHEKQLEGDELYESVLNHFISAKATNPESAPNWRQIPLDDEDRVRIPVNTIMGVSFSFPKEVQKKLLETGKYVPQNHTSEPMDIQNMDPASTSLEKTE